MKIGNYYVDTVLLKNVERIGEDDKVVTCSGIYCKLYKDPAREVLADTCFLAEGYEIADTSLDSVKQGVCDFLEIKNTGITAERRNDLLENFIGWFLENQADDEELYNTLHNAIGMTKDELHEFDVESLDRIFNKEERNKGVNYAGEVRSSVKKEYSDFIEELMRRNPKTIVNGSKKTFFYQQMYRAILRAENSDGMYRALSKMKGNILDRLYKEYSCSYEANFCTRGDAREFIDNFCENMGLNEQNDEQETNDMITAEDMVEQAVYVASNPNVSEEEQAKNMLGMLGANIVDEEVYQDEDESQTLGGI